MASKSEAKQKAYTALVNLPGGISPGQSFTADSSDPVVAQHESAGLIEAAKGEDARNAQPADLSPTTAPPLQAGAEPPAS